MRAILHLRASVRLHANVRLWDTVHMCVKVGAFVGSPTLCLSTWLRKCVAISALVAVYAHQWCSSEITRAPTLLLLAQRIVHVEECT